MMKTQRHDLRFRLECATPEDFQHYAAILGEAWIQICTLQMLQQWDRLPCCMGCGEVRYSEPLSCEMRVSGPKAKRKRGIMGGSIRTVGHVVACQETRDTLGVFSDKEGTCYELAAVRAARHRATAIREGKAKFPASEVAWMQIEADIDSRGNLLDPEFHAVVRLANGQVEDPSEELRTHAPGECTGGASCGCGGH